MTFSGCVSYCKDNCEYDEYIAVQYMSNKLEGRTITFEYQKVWYFVGDKAIYIIQLDKTICISLKTVRGFHLSILGSLFKSI